jgi:hypothetical protein
LTRRVKCDKTAKTLTKAHPTDYLSFIGAHSVEGPTRESTSPALEKWRQTRPARAKQREWQTIVPNSPRPSPTPELHQHSDTQTPTKKRAAAAALFFIYHARFGRGSSESVTHSLGRSVVCVRLFRTFLFAPSASRRDDLSSPDKASQSCT